MKNNILGKKIIIILGWLVVWQLVSVCVGNHILLVGPLETLQTVILLLPKVSFWSACLGSLLRIGAGFGAGMLLGILLAACSAKYKWIEELLAPPMSLLKAVPVASFVVIFLIWWGSAQLATVISFCIVLPNLYVNTLEGLKSTDKKLLEMAQVFDMPVKNRFFYIYRPALRPFWDSAMKLAAGMSWKSGVAAEVIGLPEHAIGEQLYMSKIYLDTAGVLAWTLVTVLLSVLFEKAILYLWKCFCRWEPYCQRSGKPQDIMQPGKTLQLKNVRKVFADKVILEDVSAEYEPGRVYYFKNPSGWGKTTLFRLVAGLEKPDGGTVEGQGMQCGVLFQEDRLCEEYSALKNVEMVTGNPQTAREHLLQLLEEADISKPCKELSGGMKRRVALARAMAANADILLLDEPLNGLDEANRERIREYIEKHREDRIVLLASHIE
ncbi:MAG: ATP-binding cassette domain-containing protein [Lachnospiraceae bacterium]|nr:ATP-binding cassette domain-containing protein [Lachnospiraceae bacterium]MBQ7777169.1 ATP-binding cassette domain-containing protein [Lachnospiraceae bacterium]